MNCSNSPLNKWEKQFIADIEMQFDDSSRLSEKQIVTLEKIWDKI